MTLPCCNIPYSLGAAIPLGSTLLVQGSGCSFGIVIKSGACNPYPVYETAPFWLYLPTGFSSSPFAIIYKILGLLQPLLVVPTLTGFSSTLLNYKPILGQLLPLLVVPSLTGFNSTPLKYILILGLLQPLLVVPSLTGFSSTPLNYILILRLLQPLPTGWKTPLPHKVSVTSLWDYYTINNTFYIFVQASKIPLWELRLTFLLSQFVFISQYKMFATIVVVS